MSLLELALVYLSAAIALWTATFAAVYVYIRLRNRR